MIGVFISHSSVDTDIAECLIHLLRSAIPDLSPSLIRCTSVPGYRLPGGADTDDHLRTEMTDARIFIGLLTPESLASTYVLFELGSRWGANRQLTPILAAGMSTSDLKPPLNRLNAHSCNVPEHLHQLVREVSTELSMKQAGVDTYEKNVRQLAEKSDTEASKRESDRKNIRYHMSPYEVYSAVPAIINRVERESAGTKHLSIGILHGKTAAVDVDRGVSEDGSWYREFDEAVRKCIKSAGPGMWHVSEIKNITTSDRLERTLERLAEAREGYEVRAVCIPNLLPCLSPLVIGEEDVLLATMDTGRRRVGAALHIRSREAVRFVNSYIALLRDYEPHFMLRTEEGLRDAHIKRLRKTIRNLRSS